MGAHHQGLGGADRVSADRAGRSDIPVEQPTHFELVINLKAAKVGCMAQIGSATGIPIVHTVELLDWASGGPMPAALAGKGFARSWAEPAKPIGHVMAEGNETSDVWGRTADIDESALSVMAERLESRAKHPFFRRVIAEYIGDLELERISSALEIGCGTGVVSRALAVAPGFRGTITATDVSPHLIDAGRRYAEMEGVEGRIAFEVINAADLHAENSTYDLIIAHTLFSHAANPVAILAECGRVLRSRGQLLIFDRDFASSALSLEKEIVAKIDIGDIARAFAAQPYIIRQLPRLLADTGFAIESHRSYVIADVGRAEFFSEQLTTWRRLLPVSGVISKGDADLLMNGLEAASAAGTLFWANNFYTFMARKTR